MAEENNGQPASEAGNEITTLGKPTINTVPTGQPPAYIGNEPGPEVLSMKGKAGDKIEQQAAPVAAPMQQIAPVSANGVNTSARESLKSDMPDNASSQKAGVNIPTDSKESIPPVPPASTSQPEAVQPEAQPEEAQPEAVQPKAQPEEAQPEEPQEEGILDFGSPLGKFDTEVEGNDPLEEAKGLISTMPGRMRIY